MTVYTIKNKDFLIVCGLTYGIIYVGKKNCIKPLKVSKLTGLLTQIYA